MWPSPKNNETTLFEILTRDTHKMPFPLNSSNDVLIVFPYNLSKLILMAGSNFLSGCKKILSGRMVRDGEKPHLSFKAYNGINNILYVSIHSYLSL